MSSDNATFTPMLDATELQHQSLVKRGLSSIGGFALLSKTCPAGYATCGTMSCCPDGHTCTTSTSSRELPAVCCPPGQDCRATVLAVNICADVNWGLYQFADYFCCEAGTTGTWSGANGGQYLCISNSITIPSSISLKQLPQATGTRTTLLSASTRNAQTTAAPTGNASSGGGSSNGSGTSNNSSSSSSSRSGIPRGAVIAIAVLALVIVLLLALIYWYLRRKWLQKKQTSQQLGWSANNIQMAMPAPSVVSAPPPYASPQRAAAPATASAPHVQGQQFGSTRAELSDEPLPRTGAHEMYVQQHIELEAAQRQR